MNIHFLFGGGPFGHEASLLSDDYLSRIGHTEKVSMHLIDTKETDPARKRTDESAKILAALKQDDVVIVFDERGKEMSSEKFSELLEHVNQESKRAVLVVGGAFGMDARVRERANYVIALSPMIFPHDLARSMVLEQVYRARSIVAGSKYHHAG